MLRSPQREVSSSSNCFGGGIRGWMGDEIASHNHHSHPVRKVSHLYIGVGGNLTGEVGMNGVVGGPLSLTAQAVQGHLSLSSGNNVVCYNCQKTGHIKYDCPNLKIKLNQIRSPTKAYADPEIRGKGNGEQCPVKEDMGAGMTAVPSRFIRKNQYTGRIYNITTSNMRKERLREARVTLEVRRITTTRPC